MGVQRVVLVCSLSSLVSAIHAQVIIKERITIDPKPQVLLQRSSISSKPLLRLNGDRVETTMPGVVVSGSVSVTPSVLPENTAYEVWGSAGASSGLIKSGGSGVCFGGGLEVSSPFPATLPSCGVVGMTALTFVPAPWFFSCSVRGTAVDTPVISGNSATITARGTLWYTGFEATLTVTASIDESYLLSQVVAVPETSALTCNGLTGVSVTILNGRGDLYTDCTGSQLSGTATIAAKGKYAFLQGDGEPGPTVSFNIRNGRGTFFVVLDTSKGIIRDGHDEARISVEVEGIVGSTTVGMSCKYPPPSVAITYPGRDTTITLSNTNLPNLIFQETHTPGAGEQFEPSISWDPGPTLSTAEYFGKITDSLVVPVKATAKNDGGTATDELEIILKKGCGLDPPHYKQGDPLWGKDIYDSTEVGIKTLGCALSCMAMAMTAFGDTVNPGQLNEWKKKNSRDEGGFSRDLINWNATAKHGGKARSLRPENTDTNFVLSSLDPSLELCRLIAVKVFNPESVKNKSKEKQEEARRNGNHWVLITKKSGSDYAILDPGRGSTKLSQYGRIFRYVQMERN